MAFGNVGGGLAGFAAKGGAGNRGGNRGGSKAFSGGLRGITRGLPSATLPPPPSTGTTATTGTTGADTTTGTTGTTGSTGSGGSPLDATYWANVNAHTKAVNDQINALALRQSQASTALGTGPSDTTLGTTYGNINYAEPRSDLALENKANAGGGLFSSVYQQNLADLGQQFGQQRETAGRNYQNLVDTIASQIKSAQTADNEFNVDQGSASVARAAALAAANPALGQTAPATHNRQPGQPKGAVWRGPNKPSGAFHGIGGGWWAPNKGSK